MDLIDFLRQRLTEPLPGIEAHRLMVPYGPDIELRIQNPPETARKSAVLIPLLLKEGGLPDVLFTLRSETLRSHRGQISFPGGRLDEGEDAITAAVRELHEETGIAPSEVTVLGTLSNLYIPPSNSSVTPVVGVVQRPTEYRISEAEVREIFDVPLTRFLDPTFVSSHQRELHGMTIDVPHWPVHPDVPLWGATAMMMRELVMLIGEWENGRMSIHNA